MSRTLRRLSEALRPGARVWLSSMSAESSLLAQELGADPEPARDVHFMAVQFPGIDTLDYLSLHPAARQTAFFMSPAIRRGIAEERAELFGLDYTGIVHHLKNGEPADVAIAQVSPPDAQGRCSMGLSADFMPLAWARARRRYLHINPRMPRTNGSFSIDLAQTDGHIEADTPLLQYADPVTGDVDRQIARHAAALVRDGDTLQFGIGTVPLALAEALTSHRNLRLRTGMVTSAVRTLARAGALDPQARITTGVALGDGDFYDDVAHHEQLWFTDVSHTHDVHAIAAIPRFVAVNSAVEVDLFGQVNSERTGGQLQAGAGGLPAFAQGALGSEGGRLMICLRSTAARGTVSRIVPSLGDGGLCTLPRYWADTVVTEHGVAELRSLSLEARAQVLIAIAAPEHRAALGEAWGRVRARS